MRYNGWDKTTSGFGKRTAAILEFCFRFHTKFRWYISVHGWDKITFGFGSRTAAILEFYLRFLFLPTFRHRRVILQWRTKFRHNQTTLGGVMTSYRFLKMAAGNYIGFDLDNIRPPTKCNCWSAVDPQIWSWSDLLFTKILRFLYFAVLAWNCLFTPIFWRGLGIFLPNDITHRPNPQKALPYAEIRRLSHKAWKSVQRFDLGSFPRKKDRTGQSKKSQSGNISPI